MRSPVSDTQNIVVKEYYRQVTEIDIGEVTRDLLDDRIGQKSPHLLQCDCPNHESQSGRSLHIMLDEQGWYCFGCGVGGDVLQLVEFVQSGQVTRGQTGPMPESHRRARDYLAEKVGLPPLSGNSLTPEQVREAEENRALELRAHEVLTALASVYHLRLKESPEIQEWLHNNYGLSEQTIDGLLIGHSDNGPWESVDGQPSIGVIGTLTCDPHNFTSRELAASGAFRPTSQDGLNPFFDRRVVFPYWSRGRVVFMIGRKTPWTPNHTWEEGKYKKLPVHNEHTRKHIAPCINNGHLFNEDVLLSTPDRLIVTEGVTDCLALMERGFAALSPATVRIRREDWGRLLPKLRGVKTIYICQDNEVSQVGLDGALQTARILSKQKIDARIVRLPLDERQDQARQKLQDRYRITADVGAKALAKHTEELSAEEKHDVERLLSAAKIDVNDYFAAGHSAQDFEALLSAAQTPIEFTIGQLLVDIPEADRTRLLEPVLPEISRLSSREQNR